MEEFIKKCMEISVKTNVPMPKDFYRYAPFTCLDCGKDILVFKWPTNRTNKLKSDKLVSFDHFHKTVAPSDAPKTLVWTKENWFGWRYLVNTCPYCRKIQGAQWFLHELEASPFYKIESSSSFNDDMQRIANLWERKRMGYFETECEECGKGVDKQIADSDGRVLCFDCYDRKRGET